VNEEKQYMLAQCSFDHSTVVLVDACSFFNRLKEDKTTR